MHSLRDKLIKAGLITEAPAPQKSKGDPATSPPTGAEGVPRLPGGTKVQQRLTAQQQLEGDKRLRELATRSQVPIGCTAAGTDGDEEPH